MHRVPTHQAPLLKSRVLTGLCCVLLVFLLRPAPVHAQASFDCTQVTDVPVSECEALVALYNSTGGPNWRRSTNWLTITQVGSWLSVVVTDGHVSHLRLSSNNLTGALPSEIGQLTGLRALQLSANQLSALPPEFGQLTQLRRLFLQNNQLSALPPEFGQIRNLQELHLNDNQLSALPPGFGQLSSLEGLNLDDNQLSALPPEIGKLSLLLDLRLRSNQISGPIPAVLVDLPLIMTIDLQNNDLCGPVPHFNSSATVWLDGNPRIGQPCDSDDTSPPVCGEITLEHNLDGDFTAVTTTAQDPESGIASAHFSKLRNLHGFLNGQGPFALGHTETFVPATTPSVTIRGERITMNKGGVIVVTLTNGAGLTRQCDPVIETLSAEVPEAFALEQNYPNPFNPETRIRFALPEASSVRLVVYDVLGREVAVLVEGELAAGTYEASWEGTNAAGVALAGGVYLYRITAGTFTDTRSMILQK